MLLFSLLWVFFTHPFYVSVTTIEQSRDKTALEVSARIFFDDLEAALREDLGAKADLKNAGQAKANHALIASYFKRHFRLQVDGRNVPLEFVGFHLEDEAAWCFLEAKEVSSARRIDVHSDLLYTSFKEQIHIFHVTIGGKRKSTKISNPDARAVFEF